MLLSVIVPCYNCEKTLFTTVNSVCKQAQGDIELILINDGSTDGTYDEMIRLKNIFPAAIIENFTTNRGVSAARNRGIELATGTYIAFLDADDAWKKDFFSERVQELLRIEKYDILRFGIIAATSDFSYGLSHTVKDEEIVIRDSDYLNREIDSFAEYIYHSKIIKNKIQFSENVRLFEDRLFLYEALFSADKLLCSSIVMYICRIRNQSVSRNIRINTSIEEEKISRKWTELAQKYDKYENFCYSMASVFAISSIYRELLEGGNVDDALIRLKKAGLYNVIELSDKKNGTKYIENIDTINQNSHWVRIKFKLHIILSNFVSPIVYNPVFRGLYYRFNGGESLRDYL